MHCRKGAAPHFCIFIFYLYLLLHDIFTSCLGRIIGNYHILPSHFSRFGLFSHKLFAPLKLPPSLRLFRPLSFSLPTICNKHWTSCPFPTDSFTEDVPKVSMFSIELSKCIISLNQTGRPFLFRGTACSHLNTILCVFCFIFI